jgi:CDP-diacylglycerol--glycerol-3-phosphate 3-phosphatidyltransferase
MIDRQGEPLTPLRRQWLLVAICYLATLSVGYNMLRQLWGQQQSSQWLIPAITLMVIQLAILWWALPYNRPPAPDAGQASARVRPVLGYANALTLLRGLLTCLLAGFLFMPMPEGLWAWTPALLYTVERLIDFADGYVARITRSESKLGEILDMEYDGLGILIAVLLGMQYGKLPAWYLLLGLGRPLFVLGLWLRSRQGRPNYDLPLSEHRRIIAGFQTGFVSLVLWPLWPPAVTLLAAYVMAVPLLFSFGRDWLVVSGVIDAASPAYQRTQQRARVLIEGWLPFLARLCASVLALALLWQAAPALSLWQAGADGAKGPQPLFFGAAMVLGLLAVVSVLFGLAGRLGALGLAAIGALSIATAGLDWGSNGPLLVCALIVAHLGSGRWAIWTPEETLLRTKAGAPPG